MNKKIFASTAPEQRTDICYLMVYNQQFNKSVKFTGLLHVLEIKKNEKKVLKSSIFAVQNPFPLLCE